MANSPKNWQEVATAEFFIFLVSYWNDLLFDLLRFDCRSHSRRLQNSHHRRKHCQTYHCNEQQELQKTRCPEKASSRIW